MHVGSYIMKIFRLFLLGIVPLSVLKSIFDNKDGGRMMDLLLRQDVDEDGGPKTYFPLTPGLVLFPGGRINWDRIKGMQNIHLAGLHVQDRPAESTSTRKVTAKVPGTGESARVGEIEYRIGVMFGVDKEGVVTRKNVLNITVETGDPRILELLEDYVMDLNDVHDITWPKSTEDEAMRHTGVDSAVTPGGIDFDVNADNLDVRSDGKPIEFTLDPAMLQKGDFEGLVPVILNISPTKDLPLFLGARKAEMEMAGAVS